MAFMEKWKLCNNVTGFNQYTTYIKIDPFKLDPIMCGLATEMLSDLDVITESAAKVAYQNFKWQYATLIVFNASIVYGIDVFAKLYNKQIQLFNIEQEIQDQDLLFVTNTTQFVLFVNDTTDILTILEVLKTKNFYANAKFIIICNGGNVCDETKAVKIFWIYRVVNVILIKYNDSLVSGYTYYQNERCEHSIPRRVKHWDDCIYSYKDSIDICQTNLFPTKFQNFHRCPLIVSTFPQIPYMFIENGVPFGVDGDLLRIITKALNATLILMSPRYGGGWGNLESDHSWTGSIADVYYDLANFSMTSASITHNRFTNFDMSINYNTVTLVWVTHPAGFESSSFKLLRPFNRQARIYLILIVIIVILTHVFLRSRIFKNLSEKFNAVRPPHYFFIHILQISLGFPIARFPTNYFYKYLMLFCIWYWLLIRTFYQVYLINSLQTDVRLNNIMSINDAMEEGYRFGGGLALREYYKEDPHIYNNWVEVESNELYPILMNLTRGMKFVLAMNSITAKIFRKNSHLELHILPEQILKSPTVLFLKKHSCLTGAVNKVLTRLFEAGIPYKLFEYYTFEYKSKNKTQETIKLEQFRGCFLILILGWILSSFLFIIEKFVGTNNGKDSVARLNRTYL